MIIAGTTKTLAAAVHAQSGSAQVATGTIYCVVQLEQPGNANDGKYWDTTADGSWQASPAAWPEAAHTQAGVWSYALPAGATTGRSGAVIHYTMTDNLTEASATTVCGGGEHRVNAEDPLATTDIPAVPSAATIASQVRTELTTELGRIDAAVTTRATPANISAIQGGAETLQTIADAIALVSPSTGSSMVTITVQTGAAVPVPGVAVSIYDATNTALQVNGTTDPSGQVVVALDDATYKLRFVKAGYTFTAPETLVVSGTTTDTFTATAWAPSAPSAVDLCVVFGTLVDAGGSALVGAIIEARTAIPDVQGGYRLVNPKVAATTDSAGYFELELVRGASVNVVCTPAGIRDTLTVPDAASVDFSAWEST